MQEFLNRIRNIRREILALKQSAMKGANSVSFYSAQNAYTGDFMTMGTILTTTIYFDDTVTTQPMCQIYMNSSRYLDVTEPMWDASAHTLRTDAHSFEEASYDCTVFVVATQPIQKITREVAKG